MFGLFERKKNYEDLFSPMFEKKIKEDKGAVVLDVRTSGEFRSGHIPGAVNIDLMGNDFAKQISKLNKEKTYLVYCQSGNRSGRACSILTANGYKAYNLAGGVLSWKGKLI